MSNSVPMVESKIMSTPMMLKPVISLTPTVAAIVAILPFFFISSLTSVFAYGAILSDYSDTS